MTKKEVKKISVNLHEEEFDEDEDLSTDETFSEKRLDRRVTGRTEQLNFKVTKKFKDEIKKIAFDRGFNGIRPIIEEGLELYKKKHGIK